MATYREIADDEVQARHARLLSAQPYPLLFVTVSGSHLYGFSSPDSDWDLRGVHVVPARDVLGLDRQRDTIEDKTFNELANDEALDELVTHDARKYFLLLLKNNGYVLEQIFSPLVVYESRLEELRAIARQCITSQHSLHYKGFGYGEWLKFVNNPSKTVKRILYVFRVLMSGIYMMKTGQVEANIVRLNEYFSLPYIGDLIAQKRAGYEKGELAAGHGLDYYTREYERLMRELLQAAETSSLPVEPPEEAKRALNRFLVELRGNLAGTTQGEREVRT